MGSGKMQPDHSGLQVNYSNEAPEVVHEMRPWAPEQQHSSHGKQEYYAAQSPGLESDGLMSPDIREYRQEPPQYYAPDTKTGVKSDRRVCGLRRRTFFILLAAVVLLVVIAAVLGGVLGTLLGSSSDDNSDSSSSPSNTSAPITLDSKSGFAAMYPSGASALYVYYQDAQGRIIENQLSDGKWAINSTDVPQNAIVATDAQSGSPLAAISWNPSGTQQRQVFYLDGNDRVMGANITSTSSSWSPSYEIPETDPATPGVPALSAFVDTQAQGAGLDGIRVDYSSSTNNRIQEVGMDFFESEDNIWHGWTYYQDSDARSGVAGAYSENRTNLYLKNSTTGRLETWTWNFYDQYVEDTGGWTRGTIGPNLVADTAIAATTDGDGTDYVYWQEPNGNLMRALQTGTGIQSQILVASAAHTSHIAAAYGDYGAGEGAFVIWNAWNSPGKAFWELRDHSGEVLGGGHLGGWQA